MYVCVFVCGWGSVCGSIFLLSISPVFSDCFNANEMADTPAKCHSCVTYDKIWDADNETCTGKHDLMENITYVRKIRTHDY